MVKTVTPQSMSARVSLANFNSLAGCVEVIGTTAFPPQIAEMCREISGADSVYLSAFFDGFPVEEIYSNYFDGGFRSALSVYTKYAYILDPLYQRFRENRSDELIGLTSIAPDNFKNSEYFHKFYKNMGLYDECAILVHIQRGAAICLSLGVHLPDGRTRKTPLSVALPAIVALIKRHWTNLKPGNTDGTGRLASQLEAAFGAFGTSALSPREADIARMILRGHSSKSIARAFDNSPETIKVHRRRLYQKLGVTSQGELLSLFLAALALTPPSGREDPLKYYFAEQNVLNSED